MRWATDLLPPSTWFWFLGVRAEGGKDGRHHPVGDGGHDEECGNQALREDEALEADLVEGAITMSLHAKNLELVETIAVYGKQNLLLTPG